jgi:hypothetical protein
MCPANSDQVDAVKTVFRVSFDPIVQLVSM